MARLCGLCNRGFPTVRGFSQHRNHYHRRPKPPPPKSTFRYHPHLTGAPCDEDGNPLPPGTPPPPLPDAYDWQQFSDRPTFEFTKLTYEKIENSEGDIQHLLDILRARDVLHGYEDIPPIFNDSKHYFESLDAVQYGGCTWQSIAFRYTGPTDETSPSWKRKQYVVHHLNALESLEMMVASPEFKDAFDTRPYEQYICTPTGEQTRRFCNLMSGQWATQKAIAKDPATHGAMLTVFALGADKMTVSTQTGNQEFHPMYHTVGNIHNDMRRAHHEAVVPFAFLAIPKAERAEENMEEFRIFKKQLYHQSLAFVLSSLRPAMLKPHILRCPDGHFRRAIVELGPFIADYPEQVYLSGIVQRWCPKCLAHPDRADFNYAGDPRFHELDEKLLETYSAADLWDSFGIVADVTPFTSYFPRADIHELLTPDILHQLIKGTFKDHVVAWVEDYIRATADSDAEAKRILDDIDCRLAAVPPFPGLRCFPNGRNFQQWTGNDSKALMKVFLPAITGYVPEEMVQCISALLDFSYLVRCSSHVTQDLRDMQAALSHFHRLRVIFETAGIRPDGFSLPRQHALVHYVCSIQLFGSPNGLCSSITESKHIVAVKRPWRRSSRKQPLGQILRTLTRLSKLAAIRNEFARRGMLRGTVCTHARRTASLDLDDPPDRESLDDEQFRHEAEAMESEEPYSVSSTLDEPSLSSHFRRFLHDQLFPEYELAIDRELDDCPELSLCTRIGIFTSACAIFYAPSEAAGPGGMHQEFIRCSPRWYSDRPWCDTVFVQTNPDLPGMLGMAIARIRGLFSFVYDDMRYDCAFVDWFELDGDEPDPVTGMWIVKPEVHQRERVRSIIPINSIIRACHLIGVYGRSSIPVDFHFADSLVAFKRYYVNWFADYHVHETVI
ncbi:hypothetical protein LXA43DRAFT_903775 [Ganoderma leucocontextum]|nr:hypothetical protein LXA43DRAFT_903775 [Ganoderma leucocontextum]